MTYREAKKRRADLERTAGMQTDEEALEAMWMFPAWVAGTAYTSGQRIRHEGALYRVRQAHTSQAQNPPSVHTAALYVRIDEEHEGTESDPIPYSINMTLEAGKRYIEDSVVYLCTRDMAASYWPLAELTGQYVEVIE